MPTIKGPITFEAGKEPPQGLKDVIKDNGVYLPFDPVTSRFQYSNTSIDAYFKSSCKCRKNKYQFNRSAKVWDKQ